MKRASTLLALGIAVACGSSAGDILDEMTDVPNAGAQDATSHPVTCDKERVLTRVDISATGEETFRSVRTTRFAEVEVPDFKSVGIERCDPLYDNGLWQCQPSTGGSQYTCEGLVAKPCTFSWGAGNHRGNTVIVDCTTETQNTYAQSPESNSTTRFGCIPSAELGYKRALS